MTLAIALARVDDVLRCEGVGHDAVPDGFGDAERARWASMAPAARAPFVAGRCLLRRVLEGATGVAGREWRLSATAGRAPVASPRAEPATVGLRAPSVSLAHRLGWVAAAVGSPGAVGVDVECDRPPRSPARERAELMLSAGELVRWSALPEPAREAALLRAWVAKEAWFKAMPAGAAPWDFRRLQALPSTPHRANVRLWEAPPVRVALCHDAAAALAAARCDAPAGLGFGGRSFWRVSASA
jgi:phosphopantetheinyl transferase